VAAVLRKALLLGLALVALPAAPAGAKPYHMTLKEGPFELGPYSVRLGGGGDIRTPRINGFVTHMQADVVDVHTGKVVPIQRIMLHHIVFSNRARLPSARARRSTATARNGRGWTFRAATATRSSGRTSGVSSGC
jgi:hypothetical protein